jgi:large subunit ribosomal protein L29
MTSAVEMRKMTDAEVVAALNDARQEAFNLRMQEVSGQLKDYSRIKQLKKDIARLLTVQRQRELAAQVVREENNG